MGSLLHPIGSEPPRIYWLRRAVVVVLALAVVVALIWLFTRQASGPVAAAPSPSAPTSGPITVNSTEPATSTSPTPTGQLSCGANDSQLAMAGYQKVKQGSTQTFKLSVSNNGAKDCVLDLKPATYSLVVTSGTDRIWSTGDCDKWLPAKKVTLKPQKAYEFTVAWTLARSAPGCTTTKALLKPGTYVATAAFAETLKTRQVFQIVKK